MGRGCYEKGNQLCQMNASIIHIFFIIIPIYEIPVTFTVEWGKKVQVFAACQYLNIGRRVQTSGTLPRDRPLSSGVNGKLLARSVCMYATRNEGEVTVPADLWNVMRSV